MVLLDWIGSIDRSIDRFNGTSAIESLVGDRVNPLPLTRTVSQFNPLPLTTLAILTT
jgi:hypothetical protein